MAPEQYNERRKLKLLFDIGAVDQLKSDSENLERVIKMTETELGFTEEETRKYLQYLMIFMEKDREMELYKQISDANRIKYGTEAEKILQIIINQYSDRTHFIYEILQNAEDAGATRIQFHLQKEKLVIEHNGRPLMRKTLKEYVVLQTGLRKTEPELDTLE